MWILTGLIGVLMVFLRRRLGPRAGERLLLPSVLLAAFCASTAQTIVIAALPALGRDLGIGGPAAAWVLTAFMLASAVATPIAGRLGDLFGYRRILLLCLGCFAAGTLLCALGTRLGSLPLLLAGRAVSGISGGVFPLAFGLVRQGAAPARVPGAIAVLSAMFGIGGAAGMVVAGPLVDAFGAAWLFWPLLVLAAASLILAGLLPADPPAGGGRVDLLGAALLGGALVCLLLAISRGASSGWGSAGVLALFAAAVLLFAVFGVHELRVREPLVELRLLRRRIVAVTNVVTVVVGAAMFGVITLIPPLLQTPAASGYGFGASVSEAGLALVPVAVMMLVATPLTPRLRRRFGAPAPVRLGALLAAGSFVILAFAHGRLWEVLAVGMLIGAAYGLAFAGLGNLVVDGVEPEHTGVAGGVNTIARTVGGAVGAQVAAAIVSGTATGASGTLPAESGYTTAFVVFALVAAAALAAAYALPSGGLRRPRATPTPAPGPRR